jgi:hypothetical protein
VVNSPGIVLSGDKPKTPGTFRIGLNAQRGEPAKLDVIIATPRR